MNSASAVAVSGVLVVDDEPVLLGTVRNYLERTGMPAQTCGDRLAAPDLVRAAAPGVVVLDLGPPGMDGVEMYCQLRTFSDCYVLMLTARAGEVDKPIGSSVGAGDYITKSFSPRELVVRIQVLLRCPRAGSTGATAAVVHRIGALALDPSSRRAKLDTPSVELIHTEFDPLQAPVEHPDWVPNHHQLTDAVWGEDQAGDSHLVDVHIAHLHKKLDDDPSQPRLVQMVCGVGYRMGQEQRYCATRVAVRDVDCCGPR